MRQAVPVPTASTPRVASDHRPLVTFIQPYVPEYRVPLFNALSRLLNAGGADLSVAHGSPEGGQAARGDASVGTWSTPIRTRQVQPLGHVISYRSTAALARKSDIVVAELASTNLDTYRLALDPRVNLMLWGHGKAYVTKTSALDSRLELWLARRAKHLFIYTTGGAAHLAERGLDPSRITVVRNSTDTVALRAVAATLTDNDVKEWRARSGIAVGPTACFVGSFDSSKQLPLLFAAAQIVASKVPGFTLVVAGAGLQQDGPASRRSSCPCCLPPRRSWPAKYPASPSWLPGPVSNRIW